MGLKMFFDRVLGRISMKRTTAILESSESGIEMRPHIQDSSLAAKARRCDLDLNFDDLLDFLLQAVSRLERSCNLPEFTDHGLSHLESLVDRISHWTCSEKNGRSIALCDLLDVGSSEPVVVLLGTLFHDLGMLSHRPEAPASNFTPLGWGQMDLATWVRKTHVQRLESLVTGLLDEYEAGRLSTGHRVNRDLFQRAIQIACAHQCWPWQNGFRDLPGRDQGLAAVIAVVDLLDEDAARCDTNTLLHHRQGTLLNMGHWIRHGLTKSPIRVTNGIVEVEMVKLPGTGEGLAPVFTALRNQFRLTGLYNGALDTIGASPIKIVFHPSGGFPSEENEELSGWTQIPGLPTEEALVFHLLSSFIDEALLKGPNNTAESLAARGAIEMEPIDLRWHEQIRFKDGKEARSLDEQAFYAILQDS
jgi:hypothetical protein